MSVEIPYYKVSDEYGKLLAVNVIKYTFADEPYMVAAYKFIFEYGTVFNEALPDTDEISFCDNLILDDYDTTEDVSSISPWQELIGNKLLWIWEMKNQQGYYDAIQYNFYNDNREDFIVQLCVAASSVYAYRVERLSHQI